MGRIAMRTELVDAHLHLQDPRFSARLDEVIARAEKRGVTTLFCNSVNEADWPLIAELSVRYRSVIGFLGIHPWHADSVRDGWQERLTAAAAVLPRFGGIGEVGLDKSCPVDFTVQKALFTAQVELAAEHGWSLSVHCVRAWGPLVDLLSQWKKAQRLPRTMIHAFNGSLEMMKRLTELGCYISYAESLAHPDQKKMQAAFHQTPHHLLLLETDAPYDKMPNRFKNGRDGQFNQPADVADLYVFAADLLSVPLENLRATIHDNATLFTNENASW
jgi:TatD DNase family protein